MESIDHDKIGDGTRAEKLADDAVGGWSSVTLVRGSKKTCFLGLQEIPIEGSDKTKPLYRSFSFDVDTRDRPASEVAQEVSGAIDDAGWTEDGRHGAVTALGKTGQHLLKGWMSRETQNIPLHDAQSGDLNPQGWASLTGPDVINPDYQAYPEHLIKEGSVWKEGRLHFNERRAEAMQPVLAEYQVFKNIAAQDIDKIATDIERGNDAPSSIARNTNRSRASVEAVSVTGLAARGITDPQSTDAQSAWLHMTSVSDDRIPQTPEEMEGMLGVIDVADSVRDQGFRSDAHDAFLKEASRDWGRAAKQARSVGQFGIGDSLWEGLRTVAPGLKPAKGERRQMSLTPDLSFREITHLARSKNDSIMSDDFFSKGLPKILPKDMEIEGGALSEIRHDKAFGTLRLFPNRKTHGTRWREIGDRISSGDIFVVAVKDRDGAPVGALIADSSEGVFESLQSRGARRASDQDLLKRASQYVDAELVAGRPDLAAERKAFCSTEEVKSHGGQLQQRIDARREAKAQGKPEGWVIAKAYLPAALKRLEPEQLAAHYKTSLAGVRGTLEQDREKSKPAKASENIER